MYVMFCYSLMALPTIPCSLPSPCTYLRELFTIQPTRSTQSSSCLTVSRPPRGHFSSHVLDPTEPYPSLQYVFGMTYHQNSAPFLYLHRRHCQSQDIIYLRLLYPSLLGLPLKIKMSSLQTLIP